MPNFIQTGDSLFAASLGSRMHEAALSIEDVAIQTGIDASTLRKYLMTNSTRHCSPSKESWSLLNEVFPGIYRPDRFNFEGKPDGGCSDHQSPKRAAVNRSKQVVDVRARIVSGSAEKGRRIRHPAFGQGTVLGPAREPGRVKVLFDADSISPAVEAAQ